MTYIDDVPGQSAEDARVVAADEEDLVALQFRVAVDGSGHQLHRDDQDVELKVLHRGRQTGRYQQIWTKIPCP